LLARREGKSGLAYFLSKGLKVNITFISIKLTIPAVSIREWKLVSRNRTTRKVIIFDFT